MEARATAKFVRYAPRKIGQVLKLIRNKGVEEAFEILSFLPKSAVVVVRKVLKSAIANAGKIKDYSDVRVKEAWVGNGPILKRVMPGSRGKSRPIKRRTSHLVIIVADVDRGMVSEKERRIV
ncbi:MAG: 50S ribosomal protein L22 [Endomicrobium sp.]|jgi:large subunit ribosomal protein L22|nr:50S ribosomal protein L22 [Endomicrobium sp.]